jgi:hypothetical protein
MPRHQPDHPGPCPDLFPLPPCRASPPLPHLDHCRRCLPGSGLPFPGQKNKTVIEYTIYLIDIQTKFGGLSRNVHWAGVR